MTPILRSLPPRLTLVVALVVALLVPGPLGGSAEAQSPPTAGMVLVSQPLFNRGDEGLGLKVRVVNRAEEPLEGFQIQTSIYDRIESRTALHESFNGPSDLVVGGAVRVFRRTVAPGEQTTVEIDPPITGVSLEGIYPVTLTLQDTSTAQLESFTTHLIFYPETVEVPLNMALVVPIAPQPARGPAGTFETDNAGNYPLETSLATDGWLNGLIGGIQEGVTRGLRLGLAPSPRFVEELAGMSDGYVRSVGEETETVESDVSFATAAARNLERLEALMTTDGVQPLASPYSAPDLPTIYDTFNLERVSEQLDTGNTVLESLLPDVAFDRRWLFAPGSRWDEETLDEVRPVVGGDLRTFIGSTFLEDPIGETTPSCPAPADPPGFFTCSVRLETDRAEIPALVRDPDVQDRFAELASGGNDALDLQRLFAEIAFFHLERPGVDRRVVHATVPAHWTPRPQTARRLFNGLARAPWITMRTPEQAVGISAARQEPVQIIEDLPPLNERPDDTYFDAIRAADDLIATFSELGPPQQRTERLRRNLLVAESRSWWVNPAETGRGIEYAEATLEEIESEFAKITVSGPDTTLTARRSAIEVNVFNDTTYPVTVDVSFETSEPGAIRINDSDLDELQDIEVGPGEAPVVNVDAIAESSGIYQVKASVLSPGTRNQEISSSNIEIRSTNFNQIALGLTFGALAFLILFYVLRVVRRRRNRAEDSAEGTAS